MASNKENKEAALGSAPLLKLMLSMGVPTLIAQLINLLYNIVDRMYIGHIDGDGAIALTGVGICFPIVMLITAFSMLVGAGGGPLAGIALGKGDRDRASSIIGNSATILIILAVILTAIFQIYNRPILYMFGASDSTYYYAKQYLNIYLFGVIFMMLSLGLNMYITVQGKAIISMCSVLIGAISNIILDPILIFGCDMGVKGAAVATVISQCLSAVWVVRFLTSKKATLRIKLMFMKLRKDIVLDIFKLGISPFIMSATESIITIVFNTGALKYGNDYYVGTITILQSVIQMILVPVNGFTQGVQPIISYNYGARNIDRVKKTTTSLIITSFASAFVMTSLFMLFPVQVAGLFTSDITLGRLAASQLRVFVAGMLVFGLQSGCQSAFMALGRAKESLFFAMLRKMILLVPLALILPYITNSVEALYYAEPISDVISALTCFAVFVITLRKITRE